MKTPAKQGPVSEIDAERRRAHENVREIAQAGMKAIETITAGREDYKSPHMVPAILGEMFRHLQSDPRAVSFHNIDWALGAMIGGMLEDQLPAYESIFRKLKSRGMGRKGATDMGGNCGEVYALFEGEGLRVFGFETQNMNLMVLLQDRYDGTRIHVRRWWDSYPEKKASGHHIPNDEEFLKLKKPGLADAIRLADAASQYADNLPGVSFVRRPDLAMYQKTGFALQAEESCPGLRYLDMRDAGYVLSTKHDFVTGRLTVDRPSHVSSTIQYAMGYLASLTEILMEVPDPQEKAGTGGQDEQQEKQVKGRSKKP